MVFLGSFLGSILGSVIVTVPSTRFPVGIMQLLGVLPRMTIARNASHNQGYSGKENKSSERQGHNQDEVEHWTLTNILLQSNINFTTSDPPQCLFFWRVHLLEFKL